MRPVSRISAFGGKGLQHATKHSALGCRRIATAAAVQEPGIDFPVPPQTPVQHTSIPNRRDTIKQAKPFSEFLTDNFQRQHDYLRISVTERCNLRCLYCMPEEGVPLSPPAHLLSSPEIFYLSSLFVSEGVNKIRLTGGEPTIRKDIVPLMRRIGSLRSKGLKELALTTNGISLHRKLDSMVEAGLTGVNLSLDTLDPYQFQIMTRRNGFEAVQKSINRIQEMNKLGAGVKLKINCVVMRGLNDREILDFVEATREQDIEVRFIEYMPFGGNKWSEGKMFPYQEMLSRIRDKYPGLERVQGHKNDTSKTYAIPGFVGRLGFITSMTNDFCGTCNRLRITADGNLKVCLHGNTEVSLRDILRQDNDGKPIDEDAFEAMKQIEMDRREGMLEDGSHGWSERERGLLDVIGAAVKRKKEKHAGIGELENMTNRPMILIDELRSSLRGRSRQSHFRCRKPLASGIEAPYHLMSKSGTQSAIRAYSTYRSAPDNLPLSSEPESAPKAAGGATSAQLPHLTTSGAAHMVSVSAKSSTHRTAVARGRVVFSNPTPAQLIASNAIKKGDVLSVARIAGIVAAKQTPTLIPLCHPIMISHVGVDIELVRGVTNPLSVERRTTRYGAVEVEARVECTGTTGVEMEALTAASATCLTVYDMCKAVDKGMVISDLRVVLKEGGRSGTWTSEDYARKLSS